MLTSQPSKGREQSVDSERGERGETPSPRPAVPAIERQLPSLRRFALALTRNEDTADDLVQDCLLRALSNMGQFQSGTNLRSWLFTILHNIFCDQYRRRLRHGRQMPLDDWHERLPQAAPQPAAIQLREVAQGFASLSREQQALLIMVGVEGESHEAAARHFGVAVGTIKSRLSRARVRLLRHHRGLGRPPKPPTSRLAA